MEFNQLHFSHPEWLWGIATIPLVWLGYFLFFKPNHAIQHLDKFIDSHLLPYLLVNKQAGKRSGWKTLLLWSVVWTCLVLSVAGPRWSYREIEMLSKDQSLVILLDLSESMNATDIKPSRLIRAKQKIEDLINHSQGVNLGLVAFAADPHMITPITEDKETIRHLLPTLETDLVHVQGSRLSPALEMASVMLDAEPGTNKAILVISDGDYEDGSAIAAARKLAARGIVIHAMGIGTTEGTILLDKKGSSLKKNGAPILSKLLKTKMEEISNAGNGSYFEGRYAGDDEKVILKNLETRAESITAGKTKRLWEEHFYLLIIPVLPIFLWWFRRGAVLSVFFILLMPAYGQAGIEEDYFMNSEEVGERALNEGNYQKAAEAFQDPYRKGVALYKSGQFAEAEKMFKLSSREDVAADAAYNRGNCLVQQKKYKEAIKAYEKVLKQWPEHEKASENLALVKKMLEEQQQNKSKKDNSDKQDKKDKNEKKDQSQDQNQDSQEEQQQDQEQDQQDGQEQESSKPENSDGQDGDESDTDESDERNADQDDKDSSGNQQPENGQDENQGEPDTDKDQQEAAEAEQDEGDGDDSEGLGAEEAENEQIAENAVGKEGQEQKSQADQDADLWLNRITNDPKKFMKNKFYIESKQSGTKEGIDPW